MFNDWDWITWVLLFVVLGGGAYLVPIARALDHEPNVDGGWSS